MKLKWYEWDGVGDIPSRVKEVCFALGWVTNFNKFMECPDFWKQEGENTDIIAYTLGEPLEVDCRTCKHDGGQPWFPSGCTGCFADKEHGNYEPLEGGE